MAAAHPFDAFVRCRFKRIGCVRGIKVNYYDVNMQFVVGRKLKLQIFMILTHFVYTDFVKLFTDFGKPKNMI